MTTSELTIVEIISQIGFPIAAYLLMYFHLSNIVERNTAALERMSDSVVNCPFKRKGKV